ncbi:division/cell wall cluster transcriptional repressor MraZ, partial [Candidatus Wolfebacteria bacterium]|nr:division/cell wall cluster transcriptional repressor MraZ [Candidatus Wolfebacteria bacterium]
MLIGEYQHTIDQKRRLAIPSKLREDLGSRMILTRGLDNCLFLYSLAEWNKVVEKLNHLPVGQEKTRSFVRLMLSGAVDIELDSLGRILIPEYLKNYASLNRQAVVAG